jgi:hypothetical protein
MAERSTVSRASRRDGSFVIGGLRLLIEIAEKV